MPLALAVLFPVYYLYVLWATRRGGFPSQIWLTAGFLIVVQGVCLWICYLSGVRARFLSAANADLMAIHEDGAIRFFWEWGAIGLLVVLVVAFRNRRIPALWHLPVLILLAVQWIEAIWVGHAGGQLLH